MNPFNYELNDEQWAFIFLYYTEYAASPYEMMSWLFNQALEKEKLDNIYSKPNRGGRKAGQDGESESDDEETGGKSRAVGVNKQKNKKDNK